MKRDGHMHGYPGFTRFGAGYEPKHCRLCGSDDRVCNHPRCPHSKEDRLQPDLKMTKTDHDLILADLRRQRDNAAAIGDHAEALILNDRINDFKEGRTSANVERIMKQFESGLARLRAANPRLDH